MYVAAEGKDYRTVWVEGAPYPPVVHMIDQTKLPVHFEIYASARVETTYWAIKDMIVRGAGAIGAAAAFGMAQGFSENQPEEARNLLNNSRPTAQNLSDATRRVYEAAIGSERSVRTAWETAQALADENVEACEKISKFGEVLIPDNGHVLTHCNAGWLAMVNKGTALGPIYNVHHQGRGVRVTADETRPRGQGALLTAWELFNEGVPHVVAPDTNIAYNLQGKGHFGEVNVVIVGADRIAADGSVANKIGTSVVAALAKRYGVPFYVAAPTATIDLACLDGDAIPIEERGEEEVKYLQGALVVNPGSPVQNPAFDVTPPEDITGIITEHGIIKPTTEEILRIKSAA
jgi:methylthioribose-1-phosphate isomerase